MNDEQDSPARVVITGVQIPFIDLVALIFRTMVAAVPALVVFSMIVGLLAMVFGGYAALLSD